MPSRTLHRRFDAVIFDLFGTLVDNFNIEEHDRMISSMAAELSAPADEFIRHWVATFSDRASGRFASTEENILHVAGLLDVVPTAEQVQKARDLRWAFSGSSLAPRHDALATLAALQQAGLKVGLISDCSSEIPGLWPASSFAPFFDATIFSCAVSMRKPDPRIYAIACDRLSVEPARCLYVGDGGSNELTGARTAGMMPILIRAPHEEAGGYYRSDAEEWEGERIDSLGEVLRYI